LIDEEIGGNWPKDNDPSSRAAYCVHGWHHDIMFLRTIWVCCLERTEYGEVKTTDQNHRIILQTEP